MYEAPGPGLPPAPARVVGPAIQNLAAARLGRGFVPLAFLVLVGLARIVSADGGGIAVAVGALASAAAMLAFGQRVVRTAFGHPRRPWMAWAAAGGLVPPTYGVWVLGWMGLREMAVASGPLAILGGVVTAALGLWVVRGWMKIVELQGLADAMTLGADRNQEDAA